MMEIGIVPRLMMAFGFTEVYDVQALFSSNTNFTARRSYYYANIITCKKKGQLEFRRRSDAVEHKEYLFLRKRNNQRSEAES